MNSASLIIGAVLWFGFATLGNAQQATELYIPIGESPGLSGVKTAVGAVNQISADSFILETEAAAQEIQIAPTTIIYLDRSSIRQPNTTGTINEITPGATVEVRFIEDISGNPADWVKARTLQ